MTGEYYCERDKYFSRNKTRCDKRILNDNKTEIKSLTQ